MAQTILEYLNKRFGNEMVSRMAKLSEEFEELQNAFHYGSREDFIDELADLNGVERTEMARWLADHGQKVDGIGGMRKK